ncbi:hypothetical protein RCL1_005505 [Eukaryota sp. TZLM3-RCL]
MTKLYEELHKTNKQLVTQNEFLATEKSNLEVDYKKQLNELRTSLECFKQEKQERTISQSHSHTTEVNRLSDIITKLEVEKLVLTEQVQRLSLDLQQSSKHAQLTDTIQKLKQKKEQYSTFIQERDVRINQLERQLTSIHSSKVEVTGNNATISRHLVDSLNNSLEKWKQKSHEQQTIITNLKQELEQTNLQLSKANEEVTVLKQQLNQRQHDNNQLSSLSRNRNQHHLIESSHDSSTSELESLSHHNSLFVLSGLSCLTTAKKQCGELRQLDSSQVVFFSNLFTQAVQAASNNTFVTTVNHFNNHQPSKCLASLDHRLIVDNEYMIAESLVLALLCSSEMIPGWFFILHQRLKSLFYKSIVFEILVEFCRNSFLAKSTSSILTPDSLNEFVQRTEKKFPEKSYTVRVFKNFLYPSLSHPQTPDISSILFEALDYRPDISVRQIELTFEFTTRAPNSQFSFYIEKGIRRDDLKCDHTIKVSEGKLRVYVINLGKQRLKDLVSAKKKLLVHIGHPFSSMQIPLERFEKHSRLVFQKSEVHITCSVCYMTGLPPELKRSLKALAGV